VLFISKSHMSLIVMQFCHIWPNMTVKGTRRPLAVVGVSGLFGFAGFGSVLQAARPLLLR